MNGAGDSIQCKGNHTNVYFTFGRFQPPTIGHKVLIDQISSLAESDTTGADGYIFVSSRQNDIDKYKRSKKYQEMQARGVFESSEVNENPLSVYDKIHYLKKMYPDTSISFINTTECKCPTIFKVIDTLRSAGYETITMVVGSDRVETFARILEGIRVIPAGEERTVNVKSMNVKAMSGTKMREAAVRGDIAALQRGTMIGSMTEQDVKALLNTIRRGLGYEELQLGGKRSTRNRLRKIHIKTRRRGKYKLRSDECS